jgi:Tfp pilus assembly PilM family ATPase
MWLKSQTESAVGLDMTSSTLRAVKLTRGKEGMRVDQVVTEVAQDTSYEARQDALFRAIGAIKAKTGMKNTQFRISISNSDATVKYLSFPHLLEEELENAIKLQVDSETAASPYPLTAQHFIADRTASGVRVTLVLFPKERLNALVEFCRHLESPLDGVEVEASSYCTTCISSEQIPDTGAVVLDLRADAFNLHVLGRTSPVFSRVIPNSSVWNGKPRNGSVVAGETVVQGSTGQGPLPTTAAPGTPKVEGSGAGGVGPSSPMSYSFSSLSIRSLAREIHDTLQYLEFELRGSEVAKLILAGDLSRQEGLERRLRLSLGIMAEPLRLPSFLSADTAASMDPRLFGIALGASYGAF